MWNTDSGSSKANGTIEDLAQKLRILPPHLRAVACVGRLVVQWCVHTISYIDTGASPDGCPGPDRASQAHLTILLAHCIRVPPSHQNLDDAGTSLLVKLIGRARI